MKKAEKRLAALAERQQREAEKRAISIAKILGSDEKRPETRVPIKETPKRPTLTEVKNEGLYRFHVFASWEGLDREGSWSWGVSRDFFPDGGKEKVERFVSEYHERKTWQEVVAETTVGKGESVKKKHVAYPLDAICAEASKRLVALKKDDRDDIFRFRMSNLERLYGFRIGAEFELLWFDPTHQICPVDN